jgi:molybdenum cofactor cytidylyltransferase
VIQLAAVDTAEAMPLCVAAIILAAGSSERMGRPKQLLPIDGQPMLRHVTEAVCASGLDQVVVVLGAHAGTVQAALVGLPIEIVHNQAWREGLSTSLRAGVGALRPDTGAVLVVLADQPALTSNLLRQLVERYRATQAPIVAPFHRGQRGNPVLFDRSLFPELLAVRGDRGAREVIERYKDQMERVTCDDPAVVQDVDTLQDYETTIGSPNARRE